MEEKKEKLKEQYGITGEENEEMLPEEYKMQRDELTRYGEPYHRTIAEYTHTHAHTYMHAMTCNFSSRDLDQRFISNSQTDLIKIKVFFPLT